MVASYTGHIMAEEKQTENKPSGDEPYLGYDLYPQRDKKNRESISSKLLHLKQVCKNRLQLTLIKSSSETAKGYLLSRMIGLELSLPRKNTKKKDITLYPSVKVLLQAMEQSGCQVFKDRHFSCEDCSATVRGGFDPATSQIVVCQNNIGTQDHMDLVVKHELIHAFDYCRAHVDFFKNLKHVACSEIRAANLSGECSLGFEMQRFSFGLKSHHQTCVRSRATMSIMNSRKVSKEVAEKTVDEVFDSCVNDLEPYDRIPYNKVSAHMSYREYMNRARYYANI